MSEAYECDRCEGLNSGSPHTLLSIGDGEPRYGRQDSERERHGIGIENDGTFDLCPGCRTSLEEWFKND